MKKPPPDRDGPGAPTGSAMSPAERQRRYRARKKAGMVMMRVVLSKKYLDDLVSDGGGRIGAEELDDPQKLGAEIEEDHDCKKRGTFRRGPIVTGTETSS